jgi:hypothetical protein
LKNTIVWIAMAMVDASLLASVASAAQFVHMEESKMKTQGVKANLIDAKTKLPFSFVYDGKASETLLAQWPKRVEGMAIAMMVWTTATAPRTTVGQSSAPWEERTTARMSRRRIRTPGYGWAARRLPRR